MRAGTLIGAWFDYNAGQPGATIRGLPSAGGRLFEPGHTARTDTTVRHPCSGRGDPLSTNPTIHDDPNRPGPGPIGDPQSGHRQWLGVGLVLISTICFAMSIVLARLSYDGGVNPITLLTIRITFFLAALLLFLRLAGKPIRLQPRERYASLFLGAIVAMGSFGSYSSIEYIPVSLMVLILYTYPILVAVAMRFTAGERMTPIKVIALLTAFLGLALALQVAVQQKAPIGFAFAAMGAIGLTLTVLVSNRILRRTDSRRMTVHMSMTTTALYATALIATDSLSLPQTDIGWYALCIIPPLWVRGDPDLLHRPADDRPDPHGDAGKHGARPYHPLRRPPARRVPVEHTTTWRGAGHRCGLPDAVLRLVGKPQSLTPTSPRRFGFATIGQ